MRRKNITPAQKRQVRERLRQKHSVDEVARETGLSVSSVYKIRKTPAVTTHAWKQQSHEEFLLAVLRDLEGIATFPVRDRDIQTWASRPEERRWPISKGYASQDEQGVVSVRLSAEDGPEWPCLRQHLKGRPLWRLLEQWRAAYAADLSHRRSLYQELVTRAEAATGMPVFPDLISRRNCHGLDHYYVFTIYDQVVCSVVGLPLQPKRREEFALDGGQVSLGGRLVVSAVKSPGAKAAVDFLLVAQTDLATIPQATAAARAYHDAVKATDDLKQELGKIRVMGGLPAGSRCDTCP